MARRRLRAGIAVRLPRLCGSAALFLALLSSGCASAPPGPTAPASLTSASPQQMVAVVRAAAGDGEGELAVQPLRDPRVEDLREAASRLEGLGDYAGAAAALDEALAIVAEDPALLQERAEAALLLGEVAQAEGFALRAQALGAQVGPLCRRHWATAEQARLAAGDAAGAASARRHLEGCKVAAPDRF